MVLETRTSVIQTKNAMTQYITIPSTMVSDSQYPFRGVGKVRVLIEPESETMIVTKENIKLVSPREITITVTEDGFHIRTQTSKDLKCILYVKQGQEKTDTD